MRARDESTLEEDYNNERHVLSALRCLHHPSIVRLVTAYRKGDTYNFLFPVADGDLQKFLSLENRPAPFESNQAIYDALWSLSSAIESMHSYFSSAFDIRQIGCHYDIKPGNILYQGDRFLLSDFGLSRLKDLDESSRSQYKGVEGSYIAPECEPASEGFQRAKIGRSSDTWSFGCFLCDILAYLCGGRENVSQFSLARRQKLGSHWARYFHAGDRINPAVTEFLQSIHEIGLKEASIQSLSSIIKAALQMAPECRLDASQITLRLFHLAQSDMFRKLCSQFEDYPNPRDFEFEMEHQRLKIWAETVGLTSAWENIPTQAWLASPRSHGDLDKIRNGLKNCYQEIEFILDDADIRGTYTYHKYYRIQRLLDDLWDMQLPSTRKYMTSQLEDRILDSNSELLPSDSNPTIIKQEMDQYEARCGSESSKPTYRRIMLLSIMKQIAAAIRQQQRQDRDPQIDKETLTKPFTAYHGHFLTTLEGSDRKVLIERMIYGESWLSRVEELLHRIQAIATLRSDENIRDILAILECIGYYHEATERCFGLVYELPSFGENTHPKSLHDIIGDTQDRHVMPSLTLKFDLAIHLVENVLTLHKAGWFHKNICSSNLMCFPSVFPTEASSISRPWITGFNYSRLSHKTAFTQGPGYEAELREYQHPEYLKFSSKNTSQQISHLRFREDFEYYSVGLVLLEIACWKPLKTLTKSIRGSPADVRRTLLRDYVPLAQKYMGDTFGDAISMCLTSYSGVNAEPNEARKAFERRVVNPLRDRRV